MDTIAQLFDICIFPLLAVLTAYAVQFIRIKTTELKNKSANELVQKYTEMISNTIEDCVIATNQTYVETLKAQGKFDAEAQKEAFNKTFNAVLNILSEDAKKYIEETAGDLTIYLTQQIEARVNKTKKYSIII